MINHLPLVSIRLTVLTGVSQSPVSQDYAPLIAENGLDPCCGHLAKGSWLGGPSEPPGTPGLVNKEDQRGVRIHKIRDL